MYLCSQLNIAEVSLENTIDGSERGIHIQLKKEIWGRDGCREFLQELNFKPTRQNFHGPWVTLFSAAMKLDLKSVTISIIAVFGE